jgi:hypothetical protein
MKQADRAAFRRGGAEFWPSRSHTPAVRCQTSVRKRFGISIIREPSNPSDITHNLRTAVIDSGGRLRTILDGTSWDPAELLTALRQAH